MSFLSKFLIIAGLLVLFFGAFLVYERYSPRKLEFNNVNAKATVSHTAESFPKRIIIPALKINLPILPAQIINNEWEATSEGVSYLVSSPVAGTYGNSILYGHNWANLLGPLTRIKVGDEIQIELDREGTKTFIVEYTMIVYPTQTSILDKSDDFRITIYTCTGFLDSQRFVVTALLKQ